MQKSERASKCGMKYLHCVLIITYRPKQHCLRLKTALLSPRRKDIWQRILPVGGSSGAPGQPLLHKSQTRTSMTSSVFNKRCMDLWVPSGKPFMVPGCVVGLNVISMHMVLQALGQTLQTHSCCIRAWRANRRGLLLQEACDIKSDGLQWWCSNVAFHLILFSKGADALRGSLGLPPLLNFTVNAMTVGISSGGWMFSGKEMWSQRYRYVAL